MVIFDNAPLEVSSGDSVVTAMHLAAAQGHEEALAILLSRVSDRNAFDKKGRTALHLAALNGHEQILKTLLQSGGMVSIHDETENKQTAVHIAAANGYEDCLRVLLDNTEDSEVLNARDARGQTPLMLAVANGHQGTVELLIVYASELDAVDNRKRTPLFRGAAFGQEACVHVLLEMHVSTTKRDVYGQTAFHIAAKCGQVGVLRILLDMLENPASVHDLIDRNGFTPLHWAAYEGHEGCVDVLLSSMTEHYSTKGSEFSPLHCAVYVEGIIFKAQFS